MTLHGMLVVDKPAGMTSHDVVAKVRRALREKKVGHAGTLDPGATGVLVLGVGRGTRLLRFAGDTAKTYSCDVVFGSRTSTLDDEGEVVAKFEGEAPNPDNVRKAAVLLGQTTSQIPPMVSAIKIEGKKLYELAREGIEVERQPRQIRLDALDVEPTDDPWVWRMSVTCSAGTYVRVLAADLGEALGVGAHLRRLRRHSVGVFTESVAVVLDKVDESAIRPLGDAVGALPTVVVDSAQATDIRHGKGLPVTQPDPAPGFYAARLGGVEGELVAVLRCDAGVPRFATEVVIALD
jgi:tRNA pseudouridine55 synthase